MHVGRKIIDSLEHRVPRCAVESVCCVRGVSPYHEPPPRAPRRRGLAHARYIHVHSTSPRSSSPKPVIPPPSLDEVEPVFPSGPLAAAPLAANPSSSPSPLGCVATFNSSAALLGHEEGSRIVRTVPDEIPTARRNAHYCMKGDQRGRER